MNTELEAAATQALEALKVLLDEWTPARQAQLKGIAAMAALSEALEKNSAGCTCRLQADECDGQTAIFHPMQVGASCTTRNCGKMQNR